MIIPIGVSRSPAGGRRITRIRRGATSRARWVYTLVSHAGLWKFEEARGPPLFELDDPVRSLMYTQCRYEGRLMTTQLAKWGNSLGLRIPKSVALEAQVRDGDEVEVTVRADGAILITPARPRYTIEGLVGGITGRNRHRETDWDGPVGEETW
jgi:antitoxin MazE